MNHHLTQATRDAIAAALEAEIAAHRADYPGSGYAIRGGMTRALRIVRTTPVPAPHPELGTPMPASPAPSYEARTAEGLSQAQLDGLACVECGVDARDVPRMTPAGHVAGYGQLFRCSDGCPPPARPRMALPESSGGAVSRHVDAMASPAPELTPAVPVVWVREGSDRYTATVGEVEWVLARLESCDLASGDEDEGWWLYGPDDYARVFVHADESEALRVAQERIAAPAAQELPTDTDALAQLMDSYPGGDVRLYERLKEQVGIVEAGELWGAACDAYYRMHAVDDEAAAPELPGTVYVLRGALVDGVIDGVYVDRAEAIRAAESAIRAEATAAGRGVVAYVLDDVDGDGCASVHGGGRAVHVLAVPLHTPHGLPVVGADAVTEVCGRQVNPLDPDTCARPAGHGGDCSPDPAYVDRPHACPELPETAWTVLVAEDGRHFGPAISRVFLSEAGAEAYARRWAQPGSPERRGSDGALIVDCASGATVVVSPVAVGDDVDDAPAEEWPDGRPELDIAGPHDAESWTAHLDPCDPAGGDE